MTQLQQKIQDVYNKFNSQDNSFFTIDEKNLINLCLVRMFELHSINNEIIKLESELTEQNLRMIENNKKTMINWLNEMNDICENN